VELVRVPAVAVTVAVVCPDKTVTLDGTVSAALLLIKDTSVPVLADSFRLTVQVVEAFEASEDGAHVNVDIATGGFSVSDAVVPLPAVTVTG
jgi:hypothetical protein